MEPRTTPSLGSSSVRARAQAWPVSRTPTRFESGATVHSPSRAESASQSVRGPGRASSVTEPDAPRGGGVRLYDLGDAQPCVCGDGLEARPVVRDVDLDGTRGGEGRCRRPSHLGQGSADRLEVTRHGDGHEKRALIRDDVLHAGQHPYRLSQRQHLGQIGELDEYRALSARQQPHANGPSLMPSPSSVSRTRRASATAPGVSEWRQIESATTRTTVPSTARTVASPSRPPARRPRPRRRRSRRTRHAVRASRPVGSPGRRTPRKPSAAPAPPRQ